MSDTKTQTKIGSTVAREENGNIQITFSLPFDLVEKAKKEALGKIAKEMEVPGFRKGNAPIAEVAKKVSQEQLTEKALGKILPQAFGKAINEHKLKPAIYPKFELIKATEGKTWQIRAVTCELPKISLGDYKKEIIGKAKASTIWTPGKGDEKSKDKKAPPAQEKETEVIKALLDSVKVNVPQILVEEEVNSRLSSLLDRIEKLGLNLDSYLASVGKTPQTLRGEYEIQAKNTISLELILETIAQEEKIEVKESEIDEAIKVSAANEELAKKLNTPEQRKMIASILRKRQTLDKLVSLV